MVYLKFIFFSTNRKIKLELAIINKIENFEEIEENSSNIFY